MRGEVPLGWRHYGSKEDASFQVIVLVSGLNRRRLGTAEAKVKQWASKP
jgi:hypothetical protein